MKKSLFEKEKTFTALKIKEIDESIRILKEEVDELMKEREIHNAKAEEIKMYQYNLALQKEKEEILCKKQ